jgi:hypothetical protein
VTGAAARQKICFNSWEVADMRIVAIITSMLEEQTSENFEPILV